MRVLLLLLLFCSNAWANQVIVDPMPLAQIGKHGMAVLGTLALAEGAVGPDPEGYRKQAVSMIMAARSLASSTTR